MRLAFRAFRLDDRKWLDSRLPILWVEDTSGIVAVDLDSDRLVAACMMDNWTQNSVQVHLLLESPMVLRRGFMEFCADYLFGYCKLKYVYGFVPGNNEKALKLNKRLGYEEVYRMPEAFASGVDYVIMCLTPERCIYFKEDSENGEKIIRFA